MSTRYSVVQTAAALLAVCPLLFACQKESGQLTPQSHSNVENHSIVDIIIYRKSSHLPLECRNDFGATKKVETVFVYAAERASIESVGDIRLTGIYERSGELNSDASIFPCTIQRTGDLEIVERKSSNAVAASAASAASAAPADLVTLTAIKWSLFGFEHQSSAEDGKVVIGLPELLKRSLLPDLLDTLNENPESEESMNLALRYLQNNAQSRDRCLLPPGSTFVIRKSSETVYSSTFSYAHLYDTQDLNPYLVTFPAELSSEAQVAFKCPALSGFMNRQSFSRALRE